MLSVPGQALALRDDVLIIVNDNSIDSPQVGAHYAQQRGIDAANIVHVRTPDSYFIGWAEFRRLRDQLIHFMQTNTLDDPALTPVLCTDGEPPFYCQAAMDQLRAHTRIRYLVTTRGVPTRMVVDGSTLPASDAPTSVDNYLKYWLLNYFGGDVRLEFNEREKAFGDGRGLREVIPSQDRELIVGRIDGLNREAAMALVDRSLRAEADGLYGTLYGSTEFNRWADHSASNRRSIYPASGLSVGALSSGWRYQLGVFDEARPECIEYLDQPGPLPEGKTPPHCRVQLNEDREPILGSRYPAPGNTASRQPLAVDALLYQGWLDGQASVGSFPALLNWRKNDQCTATLCSEAADPAACRLNSTDVFREINTDCVGVAEGFMGYNHQSWPVSYLAVWPTGWFQATNTRKWNDRGHGDVNQLAFPEVRSDTGFDDSYSLWFRNTDQVADPRCFAASDFSLAPAMPCPDQRRVVLTQKIPLAVQSLDVNNPQSYRIRFRYKTGNITTSTALRVRFFVHEAGAGNGQVDYGISSVVAELAANTDWTLAETQFQLDPALQAGSSYDGVKISIDTAGVYAGELGIDSVSVQEIGAGVELAINGSFSGGHQQVTAGDHAANFLNRLGGVAFWGSVSHHQSGGCAFCNNGLEMLIYFLRGLPLGDAVWFDAQRNSGILYGDPLYSPVAVRLNPVNATDSVSGLVPLSGSALNGRDLSRVVTNHRIDYCAGVDFFVCDQNPGAWQSTGISGNGGGEDMLLGSWDTTAITPGPYTLRLAVTSLNVTRGRSQTLNDYYPIVVEPPVLPPAPGNAPLLDNNGVNGLVLVVGGSVTVSFLAGDADPGDTLTFSASASALGTTVFTGSSLSFNASSAGRETLTVTVTDSTGLTDSMALPVIVNPPASTASSGDGMTVAQAVANGLDPNAVNGDSDGDGVPDALEIGDPDNAADSDGDGVIDALEIGVAAGDPARLYFAITPGTAQALGLEQFAGSEVLVSVSVGASVSAQRNRVTGLPLYIESDFPSDDSEYDYPQGLFSYSVALPAGQSSVSVTIQLYSGSVVPENAVVRKLDIAGAWRTISDAVIDRDQRTITLTLVDNDGVFDSDPAVGSIRDPIGIAVPVEAVVAKSAPDNAAGGGGGCVLRTDQRQQRYDFTLLILILIAGIKAGTDRWKGVTGLAAVAIWKKKSGTTETA